MKNALSILAALLMIVACAKPKPSASSIAAHEAAKEAAQEAAQAANLQLSTRLAETIRGAHAVGPCGTIVAGEWPEGYPVPAASANGRLFKIFFYPIVGTPPDEPKVYSPAAEALLDTETQRVSSCQLTSGKQIELPGRRWPAAIRFIGVFPHNALTKKLYDRTEAVALIYASPGAANSGDVERAKDFLRLFKLIAEPSLLPYYYRLNPAFWEWLRRVAGDSIPAAP